MTVLELSSFDSTEPVSVLEPNDRGALESDVVPFGAKEKSGLVSPLVSLILGKLRLG